jgi:hypothetical protein
MPQVEAADMELAARARDADARTRCGAWARTEADAPLTGIPAAEVAEACFLTLPLSLPDSSLRAT